MGKSIPLAIFFALLLFIGDIGYNTANAANGMKERVIKFHRIKEDRNNYYLYFKPANKKSLDKYTLAKSDFNKIKFKKLSTSLGIVKITAKMDRKNNITNKRTSSLLIALPRGQENSIATTGIKKNNIAKKTQTQPKKQVVQNKPQNKKEIYKPTNNNVAIKTQPAKPSNSVQSGTAHFTTLTLSANKIFEDEHNFYLYEIRSHRIKEPYVLSKNSFRVIREEEGSNNTFNVNVNANVDKNYNIIGEGSYLTIEIPKQYNFKIPRIN